ncbi:MAG: hypothetical protein PHC69_05220 [Ruminiclostridium sp.]|nr:hypothetical protein [Ruminiclostridium sp.]
MSGESSAWFVVAVITVAHAVIVVKVAVIAVVAVIVDIIAVCCCMACWNEKTPEESFPWLP